MRPQQQPPGQRGASLLACVQAVQQTMDRVFLGLGYLAGMLFGALAFFITYDVLARKWGQAIGIPTTRVTDEISGYIMALAVTWGFAYTLRSEGHVRIDVLLPYMPQRVRRWMDFPPCGRRVF